MASRRSRGRSANKVLKDFGTVLGRAPRALSAATVWRWRYELALLCSVPLGIIPIIQVASRDWGITEMSTLICTIGAWPTGRQAPAARAWCVVTPHRVRVACARYAQLVTLDVIRRSVAGPADS
jgi:hypothetical protein